MATTPNYGWVTPDNTSFVKDGAAAIRTVSNSIDATSAGANFAGLVLIKTQTIGTAVTSVAVTNAYSATYDAYKIVLSGGSSTNATDLSLINTGSTASYAWGMAYVAYGNNTVIGVQSGSSSSFLFAGNGTGDGVRMSCEVINPFLAKRTAFYGSDSSLTLFGMSGGFHDLQTSYTGFTIGVVAGTITGGLISVYGYRKAI